MSKSTVLIGNLKGEDGSIFRTSADGAWVETDKPVKTIQCITACTFTVLTDLTCTPSNVAAITLAAGTIIYGHFTAITMATGSIKGYF